MKTVHEIKIKPFIDKIPALLKSKNSGLIFKHCNNFVYLCNDGFPGAWTAEDDKAVAPLFEKADKMGYND